MSGCHQKSSYFSAVFIVDLLLLVHDDDLWCGNVPREPTAWLSGNGSIMVRQMTVGFNQPDDGAMRCWSLFVS
jgi:hypothetical protein